MSIALPPWQRAIHNSICSIDLDPGDPALGPGGTPVAAAGKPTVVVDPAPDLSEANKVRKTMAAEIAKERARADDVAGQLATMQAAEAERERARLEGEGKHSEVAATERTARVASDARSKALEAELATMREAETKRLGAVAESNKARLKALPEDWRTFPALSVGNADAVAGNLTFFETKLRAATAGGNGAFNDGTRPGGSDPKSADEVLKEMNEVAGQQQMGRLPPKDRGVQR